MRNTEFELGQLTLLSHHPYIYNAEPTGKPQVLPVHLTLSEEAVKCGYGLKVAKSWVAELALKPTERAQEKGFYEEANYYCSVTRLVLPLFHSARKVHNWTNMSAEVFNPIVGKGLGIPVLKS